MTAPKNLIITNPLEFPRIPFRNRTDTVGITVHCSATPPKMDIGAFDIDRWHRKKGWLCIGYHAVIRRDGTLEAGRPFDVKGAHAALGGRNDTHVSVCLIGGVRARGSGHVAGGKWTGSGAQCNFTDEQFTTLRLTLSFLMGNYNLPEDNIEGHRDIPGETKACPSFNVQKWIATGVASLD